MPKVRSVNEQAREVVRFWVNRAGDTYDVRCECGWGENDCVDGDEAERLWLSHLDAHDVTDIEEGSEFDGPTPI